MIEVWVGEVWSIVIFFVGGWERFFVFMGVVLGFGNGNRWNFLKDVLIGFFYV